MSGKKVQELLGKKKFQLRYHQRGDGSGRDDRSGLDGSWRRYAVHRNGSGAGHRQAGAYRTAGRCDAGVCKGRYQLHSLGELTKLKIDEEFYKKCDLHIHIPEGAIPKGRPFGRCDNVHGYHFYADGDPGTQGCRYDRRNHAAGQGAAGRRDPGESTGGSQSRYSAKCCCLQENEPDIQDIPEAVRE